MEDFEKLEQSSEETVSEEVVKNEDTENIAEETVPVNEDDNSFEYAPAEAQATTKTRKKVQTPIIIAAAILLAAILAFACFKVFFNNSVVGTWTVVMDNEAQSGATADETDAASKEYYTFEKDGTASITLGTMKVVGTWSYANDDESTTDQAGNKINIAISYFVNGTFDIELEGNAITGRTMTFKNEYMQTPVKFESTSIPKNDLKPDENFKPNDKITGTWKNSEQNQVFTFNADGTCTLNQMDSMIVDGIYSIDTKKKTITMKYLRPDESEMTIDYAVPSKDNSKITLLGIEYKRVTE